MQEIYASALQQHCAALYVYNLIDAIVAPGAKRVIVKKNRYPVIQPVANRDMSGVSLSWRF